MLQTLNIQNIALIDTLSMEFGDGMNCLTGETGAGKSIVIDAIGFVLGARASKDIIKTGKENAAVTAVFFEQSGVLDHRLSEMGLSPEEDGSLLLFRELNLTGRNICRINGASVTLSMLRSVGELLVDIHGQHENQSLMRGDSHLALLDAFGADRLDPVKKAYAEVREEYESYRRLYKEKRYSPEERARQVDLLKYQIQEIRGADLQPEEEAVLSERRLTLENAEKISRALSQALSTIAQNEMERSALEQIGEAARALSSIADFNQQYAALSDKIHEILYMVEDISREIREEQESFYFTPEELMEIEDRLDFIDKLKRKYGFPISEILAYADQAEEDLASLEDTESAAKKLESQLSDAFERLKKFAGDLSILRRAVAEELTSLIRQELEDLEMSGASFSVSFQDITPERSDAEEPWPSFGVSGCDKAEFLISTNRGEPLKPLAKIASGGELSRIMLAIKKILAHVDHVSTLIFDEIDIGISGRAASRVGEKLRRISSEHQVICVTHAPQIAVLAHTNILIGKHMDENQTQVSCESLDKNGKIREIARLLDGHPDSEITLRHAAEMVAKAELDVY